MAWFRNWRRARILKKYPLPEAAWREACARLPLLHGLSTAEMVRLRVLTTLFMRRKSFSPVKGVSLDLKRRLTIAIQACLPILELDIDYYNGWTEIIVYPESFVVMRDLPDASGIVELRHDVLSGEAWSNGPVILSWCDVRHDSYRIRPGHNVVIHEFAHKLDMLNGRANGMPPLHPNMPIEAWTQALTRAYNTLTRQLEHHRRPWINAYAATNPAEFFAVLSESFFTDPVHLKHHEPDVYEQFVRFYHQNPLLRTGAWP